MENIEKQNSKEQANSEGDTGEGNNTEEIDVIKQAREERERLESVLNQTREIVQRQEQILARNTLGGNSYAGNKVEKKEETPEEYAKKVLSGELDDGKK